MDYSDQEKQWRAGTWPALLRRLLVVGWVVTGVGFYGPWIDHRTAALALSGSDMGEFVKFLPSMSDSPPTVARQLFYLPPVALTIGIALLVGTRALDWHRLVQIPVLLGALVISSQLLPPAWSPASLLSAEFGLQAAALLLCLVLLAAYRLFGHLPLRVTAPLAATVAATSAGAVIMSYHTSKPRIDLLFSSPPTSGWGLWTCVGGLFLEALLCLLCLLTAPRSSLGTSRRH